MKKQKKTLAEIEAENPIPPIRIDAITADIKAADFGAADFSRLIRGKYSLREIRAYHSFTYRIVFEDRADEVAFRVTWDRLDREVERLATLAQMLGIGGWRFRPTKKDDKGEIVPNVAFIMESGGDIGTAWDYTIDELVAEIGKAFTGEKKNAAATETKLQTLATENKRLRELLDANGIKY